MLGKCIASIHRIMEKVHKKYKPKAVKTLLRKIFLKTIVKTVLIPLSFIIIWHFKKGLCITESIQGTSGPGGFFL